MSMMPKVLCGGELFIQAGGLEDDADALADFLHIVGSVEAEHLHGAARRGDQGGEDSEERGFAAAVRAEESEDFAGLDL